MLIIYIVIAYLLTGLICGIIGHKLELGVCPTRRTAVQMAVLGPLAVAYLLYELAKKLFGSTWWDKPIC